MRHRTWPRLIGGRSHGWPVPRVEGNRIVVREPRELDALSLPGEPYPDVPIDTEVYACWPLGFGGADVALDVWTTDREQVGRVLWPFLVESGLARIGTDPPIEEFEALYDQHVAPLVRELLLLVARNVPPEYSGISASEATAARHAALIRRRVVGLLRDFWQRELGPRP